MPIFPTPEIEKQEPIKPATLEEAFGPTEGKEYDDIPF